MVDIVRPAYGEAWASVGEKVSPALAKIQGGWIQEMMPYQWENFLQNRQDTALLYMLQKGVPEWDASQEYIAGKSVVTYQTNLYISVLDSTNVLPTVQASWKKLNPSTSSSGVVTVAGGGTGANTAADARTNLGLGSIATATAPTANGFVVRTAADTLVSRSVTGTASNIVVTNGDGVAGNISINTGSNVALLNTDSSWTSTGSIRLPSGSTSQQGASTPGRVRFNLEADEFHGAYSDGWKVLARPASAEQTPITDAGNFYTSSNVEGALQEVGLKASFVKDAILSYPDYATASAAAATLPDGQQLSVSSDESKENRRARYTVQGGALLFVGYEDADLTGATLTPSPEWSDVPELAGASSKQIEVNNAQALALAERDERLKVATASGGQSAQRMGVSENAWPLVKLQATVFSRQSIQSLVIDEQSKSIYTMQDADGAGIVIAQHSYASSEWSTAQQMQKPNQMFAHSGLGMDRFGGQLWLWCAGAGSRATEALVYRFKPSLIAYDSGKYSETENVLPADTMTFKLIDTPAAYENLNAAVSYDQKWLIVQVRNEVPDHFVYKFFSVQMLVSGGSGDYVGKHSFQLVIRSASGFGDGPGNIRPQGHGSDGRTFTVVGGGFYADDREGDPKCSMHTFNFLGDLIDYCPDVTVGKSEMVAEAGPADEPVREVEGMCYASVNGCVTPVLFFAGTRNTDPAGWDASITRAQWLMALGGNGQIKANTKGKNLPSLVTTADAASLNFAGMLDYRDNVGSLRFGFVDKWGVQTKRAELDYSGTFKTYRGNSGNHYEMFRAGALIAALNASDTNVNIAIASGTSFNISRTDGSPGLWRFMDAGEFRPVVDAGRNIGSASYRVNNSFFAVAPTVSSDARMKRNRRGLSDAEKAAGREIKDAICIYQLIQSIEEKGESVAREHVGVYAQEVISILQSHGLDWSRYGFIGYDEWAAEDEIVETWDDEYDETGNLVRAAGSGVIQPYREAGSAYSVRYVELLAFVLAAL